MNSGKSEQRTYKNYEMSNMLSILEGHIESATGKFGYAIARNVRKLKDACLEFLQVRQELFTKYGTEEFDSNGNPTGNISIKIGTPECDEYLKQLGEYADIEHSVEIYKIPYSILPEELTAKDLLELDWMLYDE